MARKKRTPQRTCIGCRQVQEKRRLLRVVRTPEGEVAFDPKGKRSGRGAYVCRDQSCLEKALKARTLAAALKTELDEGTVAQLRETLRALIEQAGGSESPAG